MHWAMGLRVVTCVPKDSGTRVTRPRHEGASRSLDVEVGLDRKSGGAAPPLAAKPNALERMTVLPMR